MTIASMLGRLRRSRRLSLTIFAVTLLALVVTAVWFISARSSLARAYDQLSNRNELLSQARMAQQEAQHLASRISTGPSQRDSHRHVHELTLVRNFMRLLFVATTPCGRGATAGWLPLRPRRP